VGIESPWAWVPILVSHVSQSWLCPISQLRFLMGWGDHSGLKCSAQILTWDSGSSVMEKTDIDWANIIENIGLHWLYLANYGECALRVQVSFAQRRTRPHSTVNVIGLLPPFQMYIHDFKFHLSKMIDELMLHYLNESSSVLSSYLLNSVGFL
jgi:hypothetical protein